MNRSANWTIADVLDFESMLAADAAVPDDQLRERDHTLFSNQIAQKLPQDRTKDRRLVFREWLDLRRAQVGGIQPGEAYETGRQALLTGSAVLGLLMGVSVAIGLLHYSGNEPINAMLFLAWTLGPQWLFLLTGILLTIERHTSRFLTKWRPLKALLAGLLWLFSAGVRKLPGEQRDALRAAIGGFGPKRDIYSPLIGWPLLVVTQVFAVCFNIGIIGTVLAELPARELRFGWQTTLDVSSQKAARVVSVLAAPWAGWAPYSHPTAQQVIDTRYAPGQAHWELKGDGQAMRSWWPFLLYAVFFYGLAIRGALLIFALWKTRTALNQLAFNHADANALWRRLTGPQITVRGGEAKLEDAPPMEHVPVIPKPAVPAPITVPSTTPVPANKISGEEKGDAKTAAVADLPSATPVVPERAAEVAVAADQCFVVVAEELTSTDEARIRALVKERYGWDLGKRSVGKVDNRGASADLFAAIRAAAPTQVAVVVIVPASRDPIVAVALFLREVIKAADGKPEVIVHLVGEPRDDRFAPVDDARFEIWRRFRDIQRLRIGLER